MDWFKYIEEPSVFIDIGVGVVNSEAWWFKKKWPNIKIFGFEPCISRYNILEKVFPGSLYNYALGDTNKDVDFFTESIGDDEVGTLFKTKRSEIRYKVCMRTLDELDKELNFGNNIFIWADTEGAELKILKGAIKLLSLSRIKGLNLEVWRNSQAKDWCTAKEVWIFLEQFKIKREIQRTVDGDHWDVIYKYGSI